MRSWMHEVGCWSTIVCAAACAVLVWMRDLHAGGRDRGYGSAAAVRAPDFIAQPQLSGPRVNRLGLCCQGTES